jgi:hypothetical protein
MNQSIVASISCNVDIQFFDKRTSQLKSRKSRINATVRIRKINGGFEIVIKTANTNDFFITEKPIIFQKLKVDGKATLKIPEQTCSLLIHDTSEQSIDILLEVFSSTMPVPVPVQIQKTSFNAIYTPESKKKSKQKLVLDSPPSYSLNPHKLKSPIKRIIIIGTGTPSKNLNSNSPQNCR